MLKKKQVFKFFCGVILTSLTIFSFGAVDFPKTPAGDRAKEVLALFNGTNPISADEYIKTQYAPGFRDAFPMAQHQSIFESIRTMYGRMIPADISSSSDHEIALTLKSESRDAWLNISLVVESEKPHRISSMGVRPGARPADYQPEPKDPSAAEAKDAAKPAAVPGISGDQDTVLKEIDARMTARSEDNRFSGTVLIAKDGNPVFHNAYGMASKRFDVPNRLDTKFNLGSCNKLFTVVAILQLMEQGKLDLDDPIGKYLEIFPKEIADKVTVRQLLTMRSGWGDYWGNETFRARQNRLRTNSDYMEFIKDIPLDFEPDSNFQHSNIGFMVAGAVIETLSGMDYFEYIQKHIYEPAGMTNSDCFHRDGPVKNLAMGYTNQNPNDSEGTGYEWSNVYMMPPRGKADGGGYSTTEDLLKFDRAFRSHKLLSKTYTDYFFNRFEGKPGDPYVPQRMYRALGGAPGISAHIGIDLKNGTTVIVLSNYDFPAAMEAADEIIRALGIG